MAASGSILSDFVSENAIILVLAVLVTAIALALSTYYIGHNFMSTNSFEMTPESQKSGTRAHENVQNSAESSDEKVATNGQTGADINPEDLIKDDPDLDPVFYCEHIQSQIKIMQQGVTTRKICEEMSDDQIAEEQQKQHDQLAEIFKLMEQQQEKFGINSMEEIQDQMRLYANI